MIKIAIVGNIAAGKSTVENILIGRGFKVFDSDKISHEILENNKEVINVFKGFDIFDNRQISRKKLAKLIFKDIRLRQKLQDIIYPTLIERLKLIFENNNNEQIIFVSVPLLFEAKMQDLFDKILFIKTDDKIRLERLISRDNLTQQEALLRMNSQDTQDKKIVLSDFVIENNADIKILESQIIELEKTLLSN